MEDNSRHGGGGVGTSFQPLLPGRVMEPNPLPLAQVVGGISAVLREINSLYLSHSRVNAPCIRSSSFDLA